MGPPASPRWLAWAELSSPEILPRLYQQGAIVPQRRPSGAAPVTRRQESEIPPAHPPWALFPRQLGMTPLHRRGFPPAAAVRALSSGNPPGRVAPVSPTTASATCLISRSALRPDTTAI